MNDPDRPLSSDIVDELLSADIDGEFDRAAVELGFTPVGARAAIDATPGAALRRAALLRARDRIATQPVLEPADELRIVGAALDPDTLDPPVRESVPKRHDKRRFENGWRALVAAGAAAAVIAAIVAVGVGRHGGTESKSSTAPITVGAAQSQSAKDQSPKPEGAKAAPNPGSTTFGDVSSAAALRGEVRTRLRAAGLVPESVSAPTRSADSVVQSPHPTSLPPRGSGREVFTSGDTSAQSGEKAAVSAPALPICIATSARAAHAAGAPALVGTGTYAGRPVIVTVFRSSGRYRVYVLESPSCAIVSQLTLP